MSNPAFMSVSIVGDRRQMRSLYQKMLRLQNRKKPLVENGFYYPKRWLGNLVVRLGADWRDMDCRGTWDNLQLNDKELYFFTESAWHPPFDVLRLIKKVYPGLEIFFSAEGDDWDSYLTNDAEGRFYPTRYAFDLPSDIEYCDTIEEVAEKLSDFIGHPIEPTKEAVFAAAEEWDENEERIDDSINLKEFEVVSLDEV